MAGTAKRLDPDARKAHILEAAERLLARKGLEGFSLEAVAREARVAASLPRHYFASSRGLLKAATEDVLKQVETAFFARDAKLTLAQRFTRYLEILRENPWGHTVWMRSAELHPGLEALVRKARQRMAQMMYQHPWSDLSKREQLEARGRIGYIEAVVMEWIARGMKDDALVAGILVEAVRIKR